MASRSNILLSSYIFLEMNVFLFQILTSKDYYVVLLHSTDLFSIDYIFVYIEIKTLENQMIYKLQRGFGIFCETLRIRIQEI